MEPRDQDLEVRPFAQTPIQSRTSDVSLLQDPIIFARKDVVVDTFTILLKLNLTRPF